MANVEDLNQTAANNTVTADGGWPEGMARSAVNDQARNNLGALRTWFEDAEWVDLLQESGDDFTVSRVSTTQFRVTDDNGTDATSKFTMPDSISPATGMWVKVTGTGSPTVVYGSVATIGSYGSSKIDITLENIVDVSYAGSGVLPATTVTKVECYIGRRIRGAAFHPKGTTLAQTPEQIPSIDDLGDGATKDMGTGNLFDADMVDGQHFTDIQAEDRIKHDNVLTNGAMQIWQRGVTIDASTQYPNSDDTYCADRWLYLSEAADVFDLTRERTVVPTGFRNSMALTSVTGGGTQKAGIVQFLEGEDSRALVDGGTCSLSFWTKISSSASIATIRAAVIAMRSGTEDTITSDIVGTWQAASTDPSLTGNWNYENTPAGITTSETWARQTIENITLNSADQNLGVFIWIDDKVYSVSDVLYITGVQLEMGANASDFQHRRYGEELTRSQRYFYTTYNHGTSLGTATSVGALLHPSSRGTNYGANEPYIPVPFPSRMRGTPGTVTIYSTDDGATAHVFEAGQANLNAVAVNTGETGCTIDVTENTVGANALSCHVHVDAEF